MHPSGAASETKPADVNASPHISHITKIGGQSGPPVTIQPDSPEVVQPVVERFVVGQPPVDPEIPLLEKLHSGPGALEGKKESAKPEEPRIEPQEEKKSDEAKPATGEEEAQTGDKRKADEVAASEGIASTEDKEAKKPKTTDDTAATEDSKKQPEVAKLAEKKARGPKKEKKVIRTGTAQRKTRSQGAAPDAAL